MIIFGKRSMHIKTGEITSACSHCGKTHAISAFVYSSYFHIFWIPIFPLGKYVATQCGHCKQVLKEKEMPPALKLDTLSLMQQSKTPIKSYAGVLLFVGLIVFAGVLAATHAKDTEEYAQQPSIGDRYYFKLQNGDNSTMKLHIVSADSLFFFDNNYTTTKKIWLAKIDRKENYDISKVVSYSKTEIAGMLKDETIFQIKR